MEPENLAPSSTEQGGTPPVTPAGQSENWEERFKGLQRRYNQMEAEHRATESSLTSITKQFNEFKAAQEDALRAATGEKAQLSSRLEELTNEIKTAQGTIEQQKLALDERLVKDGQRKLLLEAQQNDLLPLFELGHFRLDNVQDVDSVKAQADAFRQSLQGIVQQAYTGSAPQTPTPQAKPSEKSREELAAYLQDPANWNKPEFPAFEQAFLSLPT